MSELALIGALVCLLVGTFFFGYYTGYDRGQGKRCMDCLLDTLGRKRG